MRLFYGWVIVAAACAIYATVAGPVTSFGVFVKPMAQEFEWTRWSTVMAFALYFVVAIIISVMPFKMIFLVFSWIAWAVLAIYLMEFSVRDTFKVLQDTVHRSQQ